MPPGPRPPDVEFDDAAAADAIAELNATEQLLNETERARRTATTTAGTDFSGAYARDFADGSRGLDEEATAAIEGIVMLRRAIESGVTAAATRRREVEAAQREWDEQAEAERRHGGNIPI